MSSSNSASTPSNMAWLMSVDRLSSTRHECWHAAAHTRSRSHASKRPLASARLVSCGTSALRWPTISGGTEPTILKSRNLVKRAKLGKQSPSRV